MIVNIINLEGKSERIFESNDVMIDYELIDPAIVETSCDDKLIISTTEKANFLTIKRIKNVDIYFMSNTGDTVKHIRWHEKVKYDTVSNN